MKPLITLIGVTLSLKALGNKGVLPAFQSWYMALRGGVSAMFLLTGTSHFVGMRQEMVQMVPPSLPNPETLVTFTGLAELAGAAGLWLPRTRPYAAAGLTALLVGVVPANVYHARQGRNLTVGQQLLPRTAMRVVFLAATGSLLLQEIKQQRSEG